MKLRTIGGLLLGLAGVVIPVMLWWADSQNRDLAVSVVANSPIQQNIPASLTGKKIAITLDGVPLATPFHVLLEISNSGTEPILARDFDRPLYVGVGKARVVQAKVSGTSPKNLEPRLQTNTHGVEISPLLLNPGDKLSLSLLCADANPELSVIARIAGIKAVKIQEAKPRRSWASLITGKALVALLAMLASTFYFNFLYGQFELKFLAMPFGCIGCALATSVFLRFDESPSGWYTAILVAAGILGPFIFLKRRVPPRTSPIDALFEKVFARLHSFF